VERTALDNRHIPEKPSIRRPAVFFDRDGTLVDEVEYLSALDQIIIKPGVARALAALRNRGFLAVVVTNQSGVARGLFTAEFVNNCHDLIQQRLRRQGAQIDGFYFCPHHPEGVVPTFARSCQCRKPGPGLLIKASQDLCIDIAESWMVGDKIADIQAGLGAGCRTILVRTGYGRETEVNSSEDLRISGTAVVDDVVAGVKHILEHSPSDGTLKHTREESSCRFEGV